MQPLDHLSGKLVTDFEREGYAFVASGNFDQARATFEKIVEAVPKNPRGYAGLACVAEYQWAWIEAIKWWTHCTTVGGDRENRAIARTAHCLVEIGRIEQARDLFESIPEQFEGLEGQARIATMQSTALVAGLRWDECMLQFPNEVGGFLGKASVLLQCEAYEQADELLCHTISVWPDSPAAGDLWARCATAAKKWEEANARWNALLNKHPDYRSIRTGYARHIAAFGDKSSADAYLASLAGRPIAIAEFLLDYNVACEDYDLASEQAAKLVTLEDQVPWRRIGYASVLMRHGSPEARKLALGVLAELHNKSPESVFVKANLIDAYVRSGLDQPAKKLLATIPAEDKRFEVEVLRAWGLRRDNGGTVAKQRWNAILERQYFPAVHAPIQDFSRIDGNDISVRPDEVLLIAAFRNEHSKLDWFLNYYRKLGVDKFILVDNASTDASTTLLLNSPDVILYRSSDSYSRSGLGMRWINHLIEQHGRNNWCIFVDADEALVYPDCENSKLHVLTDYLNRAGYEAMQARMVDMYPESAARAGTESWQSTFNCFDNNFFCHSHPICPYSEIYGGVRRRLFRGFQTMQKVPLINGAAHIKFLISSHQITPAKLANITGALLHYHLVNVFNSELQSLVRDEIERREHSGHALERQRSLRLVSEMAGPLLDQSGVRYQSSAQLMDLGIIQAGKSLCRQSELTHAMHSSEDELYQTQSNQAMFHNSCV
jgi:thioredoxin-like negative regulator of GroEL